MCKAIDVASWFIKNDYTPINNKSGNLKLNKLLYFAQLISLIKRGKPLFKEDLYAFENGVVVEDIRKEYYTNYTTFINTLKNKNIHLEADELDVLNFTKEIFINISSDELSELTHEHKSWHDNYENSKTTHHDSVWYDKESSKINIDDYFTKYKCDLNLIENIITAKQYSQDNIIEDMIEVNGITFYYNPNELNANDYINTLKSFVPDDNAYAYTLYLDEEQGLVIF